MAEILFDSESSFNTESNYLLVHSLGMEPRELLRALMARDGDNPNSLATRLKRRVTQPQIYKYLTGAAREPRRSTLQPLAEHYDIPVEAFYDPAVAEAIFKRLRLDSTAEGRVVVEEPETPYQVQLGDSDLVIRQYRTGGAMGSGVLLRDQPGVINSWHVTPEWIQKNVRNITSPKNLAIVTGFGDSMKGMYNPGDPLLVDTGVRKVEFDGVYFFRIADEGFIKRLQRIPGVGLRAISENKAYQPWDITPTMDFEVFGRVVRVWEGSDF
jgi:phage repressor protein C with HTH and peptisase S24 domain